MPLDGLCTSSKKSAAIIAYKCENSFLGHHDGHYNRNGYLCLKNFIYCHFTESYFTFPKISELKQAKVYVYNYDIFVPNVSPLLVDRKPGLFLTVSNM